MASLYDLKPRFQTWLRPYARTLDEAGVSANQVTLAAAALSVALGAAIALWPEQAVLLLLVPPALFLRMALNALDGMLAREFGQASRLGALLNELGDVISDSAVYLPFALVPGVPAPPLILVVVLGIVAEMAGVLALMVGAARRYDGPLGKSDRAVLFGTLAVLLGLGVPTEGWLAPLLWVAALLLVVTVVQRARRALQSSLG